MEVLDIRGKERYVFKLVHKTQLRHPYESALNVGSLSYLKCSLILTGTALEFLTQLIQLLLTTTRINTVMSTMPTIVLRQR